MKKLFLLMLILLLPQQMHSANHKHSEAKYRKAYWTRRAGLFVLACAGGCLMSGLVFLKNGLFEFTKQDEYLKALCSIPLGAGLMVATIPVGEHGLKLLKKASHLYHEAEEEVEENLKKIKKRRA